MSRSRKRSEQQAKQSFLEEQARELARLLDQTLNPNMKDPHDDKRRTTGFALLMFAFGDPPQPATWISNADRADMIHAVEEWIERAKSLT